MPTSRSISVRFDKHSVWDLRVTSEQKDPDEYDAKTIAYCVLEVAALKLIEQEELKIGALKGQQSRKARAERKYHKDRITAHKAFITRLQNPRLSIEVLGIGRPPKTYGVRSITAKQKDS